MPLNIWDDQLLSAFRNSNTQMHFSSSTDYANSPSSVTIDELMAKKIETGAKETTEVIRFQNEIAELKTAFKNESFKCRKLEAANTQLEERLKEEESVGRQLRSRNVELKVLVKRYEEELSLFKKTIDVLNEDYQLIVTEVLQMKKVLVEKNNAAKKNQLLAQACNKLETLPANK